MVILLVIYIRTPIVTYPVEMNIRNYTTLIINCFYSKHDFFQDFKYVYRINMSEEEPVQFNGLVQVDIEADNAEDNIDPSASIENPNKNDPRRLFQVRSRPFHWNPETLYKDLPNRLALEGPTELMFPEHFYEVEGGIVLIYFEKERSTPCIGSITSVDEEKYVFTYQVFGWQGKKRKTFFDTGKCRVAKAIDVWRLVHRAEFEKDRKGEEIRKGQVLRVLLTTQVSDFTGFVLGVNGKIVKIQIIAGLSEGKIFKFCKTSIVQCTEILSSPLFYRLRSLAKASSSKSWEFDTEVEEEKSDLARKPKLLLRAPENCRHRRAWHFFQIFPWKRLEYCTNKALEDALGKGKFTKFDAVAFYAAKFASRRLRLSIDRSYNRKKP